jgi:hypothetical protein
MKERIVSRVNGFLKTVDKTSKATLLAKITEQNGEESSEDEHNRSFSETISEIDNIEIKEEDINYSTDVLTNKKNEVELTREEYRKITSTIEQVEQNSSFDEIFAMDDVPNLKIEEQIVKEINDIAIDGYSIQKTEEEIEKEKQENYITINGVQILCETVKTGVQETKTVTNENTPHLREYNNKPQFYKPVFGKAKVGENNFKKYLFMAIASITVGIFGGIEANSYYIYINKDVNDIIACSWSWLTVFDSLPIKISPFYSSVFFESFLIWAGVLGVIFLLSSLDSEERKASRVGHEHGNMRLSTKADFKKYINKFMD